MAETLTTESQEGAVADRLPPEAPNPSASSLASAALSSPSRAAYDDLVSSVKRGEAATADARTAVGSARDAQREAIETKAAVVNPQLERRQEAGAQFLEKVAANPRPTTPLIPEPPSRGLRAFLAPVENQKPEASIQQLIAGLSTMAAMVGGGGRANAVGALAAFTGAMKGWQEGDKDRADRAFADWKAKTETLLASHDRRVGDWDMWFKTSSLSLDQMLLGATLAAHAQDNVVAARAFQTGSLEKALEHIEKETGAANTIRAKMADILASRDLSEAQMAQAAELRREALTQQERLAEAQRATQLAIAQMHAQNTQNMIDLRRDDKLDEEAKGEFYDAAQGKVRQITKRELRADLQQGATGKALQFKHVNNQEKASIDRLVLAPSLLGRIEQLIDKINAEAPGENITRGLINRLKKRAGISADIAEFENLNADMAVELAGALSGGQPRISILAMIRGEAQADLKMTAEVARRQVATSRTTIYNRLTALTGDPEAWKKLSAELKPYETQGAKTWTYDEQSGALK